MTMKKLSLKYRLRIEYCFFAAAILSVAAPVLFVDGCSWLLAVGGVLAVLGVLWQVLMVRCPNCGDTIGYPGGHPEHCAKCGEKLDWK